MDSPALLLTALAVLIYALFSKAISRRNVTAPMIFTLAGFALLQAGLLPEGADFPAHLVRILAELTLILILFSDAAGVDWRLLRADESVPARMLLVGLPLVILIGFGAALLLLPDLGLWEAALLAAALAPTDAALARPVIVDDRLPLRIRQTINTESGLNDGLALPAVFVFLAFAAADGADPGAAGWAGYLALQVGLGVAIGAALGWSAGRLVNLSDCRDWISKTFERIGAVALAIAAYSAAVLTGGNGFIAAFACGGALGHTARSEKREIQSFGETEGQLLALITFIAFGAILLPAALQDLSWSGLVFAVASLFVIRPLAIWISLVGTGLKWPSRLFLGWFGPRGIATIVFVLIISGQLGDRAEPILAVAGLTVALSIVLHGLSARPLSALYENWLSGHGDKSALKEFAEVERGRSIKQARH